MVSTRSYINQTWIDLNSPTKEEVDSLVLVQNINPIIAKDLLTPTPSQYAEEEDGLIYAVLHIPAFKHSHSSGDAQEIDFLISQDSVITARYDSIDSLHYFSKQIEVNEILNKGENSNLFFGMMKEIYKSMADELSYMEDWMKEIEKNIFAGREKEMVFTISSAGRNLLNFKRIVDPHGNVFEFLKEKGRVKFGEKFEAEAKSLIEEWRHTMRRVNNQIELVNELRETNNSMLSTKQNEIMKVLTIMAFVTFPLSLIASVFGMNTNYLPIVGHRFDFLIVMGIMASAALLMFVFFKHKKWV